MIRIQMGNFRRETENYWSQRMSRSRGGLSSPAQGASQAYPQKPTRQVPFGAHARSKTSTDISTMKLMGRMRSIEDDVRVGDTKLFYRFHNVLLLWIFWKPWNHGWKHVNAFTFATKPIWRIVDHHLPSIHLGAVVIRNHNTPPIVSMVRYAWYTNRNNIMIMKLMNDSTYITDHYS